MLTIAGLQVYSQAFGDDNCFEDSTTDPIMHSGL